MSLPVVSNHIHLHNFIAPLPLPLSLSDQYTGAIVSSILLLARQHLTGRAGKTRRDIQRGIAGEKVARPQQQRHGLGRHDGKIFRRGKVGDAKGVPEHQVGVVDPHLRIGRDPFRETWRGRARGLGHVSAGRVDLAIFVCTRWKRKQRECTCSSLRTLTRKHEVDVEERQQGGEKTYIW